MIYHFVKHVGIDVEAESLEKAMEFAYDIDNYDDEIEDMFADCLEDSDFIDDIDSYDVHTGYTEYAGYTADENSDDEDSYGAEEDFYEYLTDDEVRYVITDKGRDYLAHLKGEYPEYDESDYDEHGKRIREDEHDELGDLFAKKFIETFLNFARA